jgi:hypothetical protein
MAFWPGRPRGQLVPRWNRMRRGPWAVGLSRPTGSSLVRETRCLGTHTGKEHAEPVLEIVE